MLDSNEIIVKSNCNLNEDDLELLTMFFENKKYSNGGTISNVTIIDSSTFKIAYEDKNVRQRILEKFCFKFHKYDLKCSSHLRLSNQMFDASLREVMLKNIDVECSVIELYAEYLSPENDIVEIKKSKLFEKTFIILYKQDLNISDVRTRFNKRSSLKSLKLELVECFKTNSFIIKSDTRLNIDEIRAHVENAIKSKKYLLENYDDTFLIIRPENEYDLTDQKLLENLCIEHKLIIENCYNFDLVDSFRNFKEELVARHDKTTQTEEVDIEKVDGEIINLIELEGPEYFNLNKEHPLAIGLFNNSKLRLIIKEYLKLFNVKVLCEKNSNVILEFSSQIDTNELKNKLNNFYCNQFSFKVFQLPKGNEIEKAISDLYNKNLGVYLRLVEDEHTDEFNWLQLYGPKKALKKAHRKIKKITTKLIKPDDQEALKLMKKQERKLKKQNKAKLVFDELKNLNDFIMQSSFTPISEFKSEDANEFQSGNSIPIEDLNRSILKKCLIGCHKIFQDFNKDLKNIDSNLCLVRVESNGQEEARTNFAVVFESSKTKLELNLWTQISELIQDYENDRLKESSFKLPDYVRVEDIYMKVIRDLTKLDSSSNKEKFNQCTNSIYIHLIENRLIEFYGYVQAVDLFEEFIKLKNTNYFKSFTYMLTGLLHVSVSKLQVPLLEIFYKFNGVYFEDLNEQLKKLNANAIITDDRTIDIVCKSNLLNSYKGKLFKILRLYEKSIYRDVDDQENLGEKYENALKWNALVREFLNLYLSNFSINKIENMPFERDDEESKNFSYDQNLLDVHWLSLRSVKILGLKKEVDSFKQKITDLYFITKKF